MNRRRVLAATATLIVTASAVLVSRHRNDDNTASAPAAQIATATVARVDLAATQRINGTLGYAPADPPIVRRPGTYTLLPAAGSTVAAGQPLAVVDGRPVVLLTGTTASWRALHEGVADGADVAQLEHALRDLGFAPDLNADGHYDQATSTAVQRWQAALGEATTGIIDDGDIVFLPQAIRVGHPNVTVGSPTQPGQAPYTATSTTRTVNADLDAARQQGINIGDPVTIDLLGAQRFPGHVSGLGRVATTARDNNSPGRAAVPLTITLDDPDAAGHFDELPVQIELTTASKSGVLAVPITALLALADNAYGVEVIPPTGPHQIVAVTIGLSASGLVEVTSDDLTEGTVVVVAK